MSVFRVNGAYVETTYLNAPRPDYIVDGLSITSPATRLSPVIVKAIVFAVANNVSYMNVDGVTIYKE